MDEDKKFEELDKLIDDWYKKTMKRLNKEEMKMVLKLSLFGVIVLAIDFVIMYVRMNGIL